jgi:hypothetical protein
MFDARLDCQRIRDHTKIDLFKSAQSSVRIKCSLNDFLQQASLVMLLLPN